MKQAPSRKLAVLLHADVVDSTGLVRHNETLAHQRIQETFRRFSETIANHGGTAHEIRGDALVAEFPRASDAVCAAIAFQDQNADFNVSLEDALQPRLRIGIAMGEVVVADNTITGDGIVLAQRLEQLAGPGAVCIQGAAYETVPKRLPFDYENLGDRVLQGFGEPVRVYEVGLRAGAVVPAPESSDAEPAALELPDKPSIAVLPFTNMSGDPEQEYFSDGLTEDIITALSRFRELFVIARNSTFLYRNKPVAITKIGRELGVRYVLEGSVRRAGHRIRVNAQLIDAKTGGHLWAERYDRDLEDIFAIQDEITTGIVTATGVEIGRAELARIAHTRPGSLNAWDCYQQGVWHAYQITKADNKEARRLFERAAELDSRSPRPYEGLARVGFSDVMNKFSDTPEQTLAEAKRAGERALSLDDEDAVAHTMYGRLLVVLGKYDDAVREFTRAIELNPNLALAYEHRAFALHWRERPEEAIEECDMALRLSPRDPAKWQSWNLKAFACFQAGRYEETIQFGNQVLQYRPEHPAMCEVVVAAAAELGDADRLEAAKAELFRRFPDYSIRSRREHYRHWENMHLPQRYIERIFAGLRKAGLPE